MLQKLLLWFLGIHYDCRDDMVFFKYQIFHEITCHTFLEKVVGASHKP